jgi:two-component sensor histidine kinase
LYYRIRLLLVFLGHVLLTTAGSSQQFEFKNYGLSDGFVPLTISNFYQDKAGFIWICQQGGLARFDGKSFRYYNRQDSIINTDIYCMLEDHAGNIWIGASGAVFRSDGHGFHSTGFSPLPAGARVFSIWENTKGQIVAACSAHIYVFDHGQWGIMPMPLSQPDEYMTGAFFRDADTLYFNTQRAVYRKDGDAPPRKIFDNQLTDYTYQITKWDDQGILIAQRFGNFLYKNGQITPSGLFPDPKKQPRFILPSRSGYKWVYYKLGGLGLLDRSGKEVQLFTTDDALSDNFITTLFEDRDDNLWVGNFTQLVRIRRSGIQKFDAGFDLKSNGINDIIPLPDSSILVNGYKHPHGTFKNGAPYQSAYLPADYRDRAFAFLNVDREGASWYIQGPKVARFKNGVEQDLSGPAEPMMQQNPWFFGIYPDEKDDGLYFFGNLFWHYYQNKLEEIKLDSFIRKHGKITQIYQHGSDLIITANTIFLKRGDAMINLFKQDMLATDGIASCMDNQNNLWIGTDKGILHCLVAQDRASVIETIGVADGLPNSLVFWLTLDADGNLWAATPGGLCRIFYKAGKQGGHYRMQVFQQVGKELPATKLLSMPDRSIWACSTNSLWRYDLNDLNRKIQPRVYISDLQLFQQKTNWQAFADSITPWANLPVGLSLDYQQNSLTFLFHSLLYQREDDVRFTYRLNSGRPGAWSQLSANTQADYLDLPPGAYTFEVKAVMGDGLESLPAECSFTISPPFWQTWWFIALLLLVLTTAGILIFRSRVASIREEEAEKTKVARQIAEIELTAIRAQMNPHFVFNALNSIQDFVLNNNAREASRYLAKFARLIRLALDNADKTNVTVANTVEFLRHYIDLESLRFPERFIYELETDPEVDIENSLIPNMMIQPHVENAIWHGIMHRKDGQGELVVRLIHHDDHTLVATIRDNGIGRVAAAKINAEKRAGHRSKGTILVRENLKMINLLYHTDARVEYEDLYDTAGNATGTLVRVFIPVFKRKA